MDASNCITISYPHGAAGMQLGRLISSCTNVAWYDYKGNGVTPWQPYNEKDNNFTKFHFNRRFHGATGVGVCDNTILPIGSKSDLSIERQHNEIINWSKRLQDKMFVYPLHEPIQIKRKIFTNSKEIFIIPKDIDKLVERFKQTSAKYFPSAKQKHITLGNILENNEDNMRSFLLKIIADLKENLNKDVFVINDISEMFDVHNFNKLCKFLDTDFNDNYFKVRNFINANT